ncbi:MAG: hypothetical protein KF802_14630 [Bdellovibrionaceae bacterium]|nr:hypothetical protein [Pseudobdellovibrionaceae bacterium]
MSDTKITDPKKAIEFVVDLFKPVIEAGATYQQELQLKLQVLESTDLGKRQIDRLWSELVQQVNKVKETVQAQNGKYIEALGTKFYVSAENELFVVTKNAEGKNEHRIIANGIIHVDKVEVVEDPLTKDTFLVGSVLIRNQHYPFRMRNAEYSANQSFGEKLNEATRTAFKFYDGELSTLRLFSKEANAPVHAVISRNFGWDGDRYLTPKLIISRDRIEQNAEKVIAMPSTVIARFLGFEHEPDQQKYRLTLKNFIENFLALQDPSVTYFVLAHVFLSLVHSRFRDLPRPIIWLGGRTGDGKSFIAIMAQNLLGDFPESADKSRKVSWTSSPKYISEQGVYFKDVIFLIDDYKRSNISPAEIRQIVQMIANISDGTGRGTLTRSRESNEQAVIRGLVIATAEDNPPLDAAGFARITLVPFPARPRNVGAGKELRAIRKDLPTIPPQFIQWFLNQNIEEFDEFNQRLRDHLQNKIVGSQNDLRIATMAAQSGLGFHLLTKFLVESNVWSNEEAEKREADFKRILEVHVVQMSTLATEEQASNLFLRVLSSLITAGEARIHGLDVDTPSDPAGGDRGALDQFGGRYVGFIKIGNEHKDTVYIDPEVAFNSVDRFLRAAGAEVGFTKNTIGKQLLGDGHFSRTPPNGSTVMKQRWMKVEPYVWPLKPSSLGLTLTEPPKSKPLDLPNPPMEGGLI